MLLQLYHLITNFSITESLSSGKIISVQKKYCVLYWQQQKGKFSALVQRCLQLPVLCWYLVSEHLCCMELSITSLHYCSTELQAFYFFHFIISILGIPPKNQEDFTSHTLCAYYHKKRIYIPAKIFVLHMPSLDKELQNTAEHMLK